MFYREGLLAPRPTSKLEDHPSSAVSNCLFNLFAATLLIGGRSSIRNMRTRHAVVTGTHYMGTAWKLQTLIPSMLGVTDSAHFQTGFGFPATFKLGLLFVAIEEGYYLPTLMLVCSVEQYRRFFFNLERPSIVNTGKQ